MHRDAPFNIKLIRLPAWALPILVIMLAALVAFAALVSLSLMLVLVPVLLLVGAAQRMFGHHKVQADVHSRPTGSPSGDRAKIVIDADYEVLDPPTRPKA
jgi:hypothetical protein